MSTRIFFTVLTICFFSVFSAHAEFNPIELVSDPNTGSETDNASSEPSISLSSDGRFIVFQSGATNLVSGDENSADDIFIFDKEGEDGSQVELISVDSDETASNGSSSNGAVSSDGRYVVFQSNATNLVSGDVNSASDIFLRDRTDGTTIRVSVNDDGDEADGDSINPRISSDGRYIVFQSAATNLVSDDTNEQIDIFLHDTDSETTTRISLSATDVEGDGDSTNPDISSDGNIIVFESEATNLIDDDDNAFSDIFAFNISGDTITKISADTGSDDSDGNSTLPRISGDGSSVVFLSEASDLVSADTNNLQDVFLYTFSDESIIRVNEGSPQNADGVSDNPSISTDGNYVAFQSSATNLTSGDSNDADDIFVYDVENSSVTRISVTDTGNQLVQSSTTPSINSSGQFIAFTSLDNELISSDTNDLEDIFLLDTQCLLEPDGVTPGDQDEDGTDDCEDDCPTDADKTDDGVCGCGVADTDTDSDGTLDCNDECPSDPDKTAEGACGCGEAETDANQNGTPDCIDPSITTKPRKPVLIYRR